MELTNKTLSITGVGGFIGLRAAERAVARGMRVRGLERSPEAAARARAVGVDVVEGDVLDERALARAFAGTDVVLHTAATVGEDGDLDAYRRVNVGGTLAVGRAARAADVRTLVHLSSVMVYGFAFPPEVDEDGPLRGEGNAYCTTKIESDLAAQAMDDPRGLRTIVIRPGDVYGPGSVPWVTRPITLMQRGLFALPDKGRGVLNHVHVDNLLDGVFLALERDAFGGVFNLTDGAATTCVEFFGHYARLLGQGRVRTLPAVAMRGGFLVLSRAAKLAGREVPADASAVRYLTRPHAYSIERARRLLGYAPRITLADGMNALAPWLRAQGLLPA